MENNAIIQKYEQMDDFTFSNLILFEAKKISPKNLPFILNELSKRNLNHDLEKAIEIQRRKLSIQELAKYSNYLRKLDCPICKKNEELLNSVTIYTIVSVLVASLSEERFCIACPSCLDNEIKQANLQNSLMGWWGVKGLFSTPGDIRLNLNEKKNNHSKYPNKKLLKFTLDSIGYIELYKDDPEKLNELISEIKDSHITSF